MRSNARLPLAFLNKPFNSISIISLSLRALSPTNIKIYSFPLLCLSENPTFSPPNPFLPLHPSHFDSLRKLLFLFYFLSSFSPFLLLGARSRSREWSRVEKGMRKYMQKAKVFGEVAVMEVSHQSTLGVRTRARALATLQKPAPDSSLAYLELRSRRLEKPITLTPAASQQSKDASGSPKKTASGARSNSGVAGSVSLRRRTQDDDVAPDAEASFGESALEADTMKRFSRETTPCSLIRDPEITVTLGSTTRSIKSMIGTRRIGSAMHQNISTTLEMEEFFSAEEQLQQRIFIEKYNFDPVNDSPQSGRFEWVKI